jgi:hypothetical protein
MNNTKTRTLAIVAVLTAATLVVGVTFAAAAHSAFAYLPKTTRKTRKMAEMIMVTQLPRR